MTARQEETDQHTFVNTKIISLNSFYATDKLNGEKLSQLSFDFNNIATRDKDNLYHSVAIQTAEIPASYYNVNETNQHIYIQSSVNPAQTRQIYITPGNYTATTFAVEFEAAFTREFAAPPTGDTHTLLTLSTTTGKFSLKSWHTTNPIPTLTIICDGTSATTTANLVLGISRTFIGSLVFPPSTGTGTAFPLSADFLGVTQLKVSSNALAGDNYDSVSLGTTTLVDTIPANSAPFGLNIFTSLGREIFVKARRIDEIDIQIRDQNDEFIDFNGINWTLTIVLNTHRREIVPADSGVEDGTINNDKLRRAIAAAEKTDTLEKELENVTFDII